MHPETSFIIGLSLDNSYFNSENIARLIAYVNTTLPNNQHFIMIPDVPAIHTMVAKGMNRNDAEKKSKLKSNALENKCRKVVLQKIPDIVRWESLKNNTIYQSRLNEFEEFYNSNNSFREYINTTVYSVLKKQNDTIISSEVLYTGSRFLLMELVFICWSPDILNV